MFWPCKPTQNTLKCACNVGLWNETSLIFGVFCPVYKIGMRCATSLVQFTTDVHITSSFHELTGLHAHRQQRDALNFGTGRPNNKCACFVFTSHSRKKSSSWREWKYPKLSLVCDFPFLYCVCMSFLFWLQRKFIRLVTFSVWGLQTNGQTQMHRSYRGEFCSPLSFCPTFWKEKEGFRWVLQHQQCLWQWQCSPGYHLQVSRDVHSNRRMTGTQVLCSRREYRSPRREVRTQCQNTDHNRISFLSDSVWSRSNCISSYILSPLVK